MKKLNKFLLLLAAVVFTFTACEKSPEREPSPEFSGVASVFFPESSFSKEFDPNEPMEYSIAVQRVEADSAYAELAVKVNVLSNSEDIFEVPAEVKFAKGAKDATLVVKFPKAKVDGKYELAIELDPAVSNPYQTLKPTFNLSINVAKWDDVTDKKAIVQDGLVCSIYAIDVTRWYVSYQRKNNADGSFDIRLINPYTVLPEYDMTAAKPYDNPIADKFGNFAGFPYNYPEDVDSEGSYNMVIHVSAKGVATFDSFAMGMTWSYGAFTALFATDAAGTWDAEKESVTFPAGTAGCNMADKGTFTTSQDIVVFLNDSLWQDEHSAITIAGLEDGFNDASIEWKPLAGELKTFISAIESDSWDNEIENAVDPNPENKQGPGSDFYNLYRLPDLYAAGFGLAFYWDTIKSKISLPTELQPIGQKYASKNIFVGPSAENESFVEEITLQGNAVKVFHFFLQLQTKDGGNLGEYEEVFYLGPKAVVWEKKDYIGNFTLTGVSPFDGSDMAQDVEIKEEGDDLIMLGVARADTIVLGFDAETGAISIEPQFLPGVFSYEGTDYQIVLATFDADFNIGFTAKLEFAFNLTGIAKLTANSEAIGYLIQAYQLGNLDGCYDLALIPAPAAVVAPRQAEKAKLQTATPKITKTAKKNTLKLNGRVPRHNYRLLH